MVRLAKSLFGVAAAAAAAGEFGVVHAIELDVKDPSLTFLGKRAMNAVESPTSSHTEFLTESVKTAAGELANGLLHLYTNRPGNGVPDWKVGLFPTPYYWSFTFQTDDANEGLSGASWTAMIDYQAYTGDTTYQDDILTAIGHQVGPKHDFVVEEHPYIGEANDDQAFWVFTALSALEHDFPPLKCPGGTSGPNCPNSWLHLATNAFNTLAARYEKDKTTCGGGLRWQYDPAAPGYRYKNSVSNGGFFDIAARLARVTGNATYAGWAGKVYDWSVDVGLVDETGGTYDVYDGAGDEEGSECRELDRHLWSYNTGLYMHGAANMAAYMSGGGGGSNDGGGDGKGRGSGAGASTPDNTNKWTTRAEKLTKAALRNFVDPKSNIIYEKCEPSTCNDDQKSFKAYLARWMASSAVLVPSISEKVRPVLEASARAAAEGCSGVGSGKGAEKGNGTCSGDWRGGKGGVDENGGLGQRLSALEVVQGLFAEDADDTKLASGRKEKKGKGGKNKTVKRRTPRY
ncbi:MAG: hypothetical protein M1831_005405 [Alyxoria varia]|nr:MAG: hypothetical protein M1831_005405 [Alyxoria varia]